MRDEPAEQMLFNLPDVENDGMEIPVDPQGRGYIGFAKTREEAIDRLNRRFGIMINQHVRLRLMGSDDELQGKLILDGLILPETRDESVPLCIGRAKFEPRHIESCVLL